MTEHLKTIVFTAGMIVGVYILSAYVAQFSVGFYSETKHHQELAAGASERMDATWVASKAIDRVELAGQVMPIIHEALYDSIETAAAEAGERARAGRDYKSKVQINLPSEGSKSKPSKTDKISSLFSETQFSQLDTLKDTTLPN